VKLQESDLESVPFRSIYSTFVEAFEDYAVNVAAVTEQQFLQRARKNDWQPQLSSGIEIKHELVAITLIGTDAVDQELIAYDICTGIVPKHRGKGVAGMMLNHIIPRLEDAGVKAIQLEVIQENSAAIRAYQKAGFRTLRGLVGFEANAIAIRAACWPGRISPVGLSEVFALSSSQEYRPSFEQRDRALQALEQNLMVLGAFDQDQCIGVIVFDSDSHWLMRLVVQRNRRRMGVASALLHKLSRLLEPGTVIKAVNIDADDSATIGLVKKCGFSESHDQWEMRLDLTPILHQGFEDLG